MRSTHVLRRSVLLSLLGLTALLTGCATVTHPVESDPWEGFNRRVFGFNKTLDETLIKPIATGYKNATPDLVDRGVTNFFSNLDDVIVIANQILQGKPREALSDFSRLVWNSTAGILGFIDVATHLDLPKHTEDFGQTLGRWGYTPGPYLVLPILGPSTARDTIGLIPDWFVFDPVNYTDLSRWERLSLTAVKFIDIRADLLGASAIVDTAALDEYTFIRDAFLQRRQYLVYDGDPPEEDFDEEFLEEELEEELEDELEDEEPPAEEEQEGPERG